MNFTGSQIKSEPIIFADSLAAGTKKTYSYELTGDGHIDKVTVTFATGENGTLHIRPYVILNGNITQELCRYGGNRYIAGDSEKFELSCFQPIEKKAMLYIEADNTGASASMVDVIVNVTYEDYIKESSIIGFEGRNL